MLSLLRACLFGLVRNPAPKESREYAEYGETDLPWQFVLEGREKEFQVPRPKSYDPATKGITVAAVREELMRAISQFMIYAGAHKLEGHTRYYEDFNARAQGALIFGINAGLITKDEFNQFQKMRENALRV